jgi:signal peptidase complex subunit 2
MQSLGYVQSHLFQDIRLLLGYSTVIIIALSALYEYKVGFKVAKGFSTLAVALYVLLNAALYAFSWFIERNIAYVGSKGDITVYSFLVCLC